MSERPLDIEHHDQLVDYLRESGRIEAHESPIVRTLGGGVSNRTVWVQRPSGEAWVLKQSLPKLRVEVDWYSDPARIRREALGLSWLERLAPPGTITPLMFEDPAHNLLAMQAVPEPHENWKSMLLDGRIDLRHVGQFAMLLATVHQAAAASSEPLPELFGDRCFFESLRLEPYYEYTATRVPAATDFLRALVADTRAHRRTLVHGDYSPKNILVRNDRLILLDHEVIHWGDPSFDVGFAMAHLLSKAHHLPLHRARFIDAANHFTSVYSTSARGIWDEEMDRRSARQTLGCLLARVAGRSPLEYLHDEERARQQRVVTKLMGEGRLTLSETIFRFHGEINAN
ncbi:MAG TPA: aminoglycoside phosphotransferase family protein [Tepidisphaeraceae bacterium]|nr:aminoglycoside phosphotransferase family protein [Tepidisphaeraceae bacterium]